jgi:hypothetical protein
MTSDTIRRLQYRKLQITIGIRRNSIAYNHEERHYQLMTLISQTNSFPWENHQTRICLPKYLLILSISWILINY